MGNMSTCLCTHNNFYLYDDTVLRDCVCKLKCHNHLFLNRRVAMLNVVLCFCVNSFSQGLRKTCLHTVNIEVMSKVRDANVDECMYDRAGLFFSFFLSCAIACTLIFKGVQTCIRITWCAGNSFCLCLHARLHDALSCKQLLQIP